VLLAVGLVFAGLRLRSIWQESRVDFGDVGWPALVGAGLLTLSGVIASAFIWLLILRELGVRTRPRLVAVYFQAQVAKYIPGSLWQYAGRVALARTLRIPLRPLAVSLPVELAASMAAAALVSLSLLGPWGLGGTWALVAVVHLGGRRRWRRGLARLTAGVSGEARASISAAAAALPFYTATWVVVGGGFWLVARAMLEVPLDDVLVYVGVFTIAWLVGLIAIYAPGGLGVREAVIVALLRGRIGTADALVIAVVSRAIFTLVDLAAAVAGVLILRHVRTSHGQGHAADGVSGGGS
jgi:uncharacterized membrane protein YbhN (UPF0104 family)